MQDSAQSLADTTRMTTDDNEDETGELCRGVWMLPAFHIWRSFLGVRALTLDIGHVIALA